MHRIPSQAAWRARPFALPSPLRSLLPAALLLASLAVTVVAGSNPCPDQPVHTYGPDATLGSHPRGVVGPRGAFVSYSGSGMSATYVQGTAWVVDTNVQECDGVPGFAVDWDGDADAGVGGAFFGSGSWAEDPDCGYRLNLHGPRVSVVDDLHGPTVPFLVAEDDQMGPIKVVLPSGGYACVTSGTLIPGDAAVDPTVDVDDCVAGPFFGEGATCGSGGGDGGYWVLLLEPYAIDHFGQPTFADPPTTGTITAY